MSSLADSPHPAKMSAAWTRHLSLLAVAGVVLGLAYFETYASIVTIWTVSVTYNHGFLIPLISAYLVWRQGAELASATPGVSLVALGGLLLASATWLVGEIVGVQTMSHFAAVASIPLTVWALLGPDLTRRILFPLLYLLFAVPFGEFLVPHLQDITAAMSVAGLRLIGIPVLLEGRFISIPTGNFEVAEACSGIRYVIASLALGTLFAYLNFHAYGRRAAFILLSLVIPVLANSLRAFGIIILAHASDYKLAVGVDHILYGWVFFGIVMFLLFWIGGRFRDQPPADVPEQVSHGGGKHSPIVIALLVCVVVVSGPLTALAARAEPDYRSQPVAPTAAGAWEASAIAAPDLGMVFAGADFSLSSAYQGPDEPVWLVAQHYVYQRPGHELISWHNQIYDSEIWRRVDGSEVELDSVTNGLVEVEAMTLARTGQRLRIWHWRVVDGRFAGGDVIAKLEQLRALVADRRLGAQWMLLVTPTFDDQVADRRLADFVADVMRGRLAPELLETAADG